MVRFIPDITTFCAAIILLAVMGLVSGFHAGALKAAEVVDQVSGEIKLQADGACGGFPRTTFAMSVKVSYSNDDSCWGRSTRACSDYFVSYVVDGENKIIGKSKKSLSRLGVNPSPTAQVLFSNDIFLKSQKAPFKFIIADLFSATGGQNPGDVYAGTQATQKELLSRDFDPSQLDPDCPSTAGTAGKTVDLGEFKIVGKADSSSAGKTVDLGEFKVVGKAATTVGDKVIDLGEFKIVGKAVSSSAGKSVDLGEFKVVGKAATAAGDKVIDLGEFKIVGKADSSSAGKTVDLGEFKVVGKAATAAGDKVIDLGEFKIVGKASEDKEINLGHFRIVGKAGRAVVPRTRPSRLPGRVKVSLIRVRKISGETNPFDPVEVEADVTAAQNGTLNQTTSTSNATALTVTTPAPFPNPVTAFCCGSATLAINAAGTTLTAASGPQAGFFLTMARTFGVGDPHNYTLQPTFSLISSTPGVITGLSDGTAVQLVVRRNSDNIIFQINVTTTYVPAFDTQLTTLNGFNCGTSATNCP